jgi:nucleoside-diphosphate-sugar epimerase
MKKVLVLGVSGNFGSRAAQAFQAAGWQVARYNRGSDMTAAARGADLIVNALNPPMYHDWARLVPQITDSVLAATKASGARVLVPGNVYVYGVQPGPWGPDTPQIPCSRKGQIRRDMEARYRESGEKVLILRGGDFLDEASGGTIMNMVVLKGIAKGKLTLAGGLEVPRAYAYLPDMARAAVGLADLGEVLPRFADVPYAGLTFSMGDLRAEIERQLGRGVKLGQFPWWLMSLTAPVWELAREMKEMRYLYETPHVLDGGLMAPLLPGFQGIGLTEVVARHLRARGL